MEKRLQLQFAHSLLSKKFGMYFQLQLKGQTGATCTVLLTVMTCL